MTLSVLCPVTFSGCSTLTKPDQPLSRKRLAKNLWSLPAPEPNALHKRPRSPCRGGSATLTIQQQRPTGTLPRDVTTTISRGQLCSCAEQDIYQRLSHVTVLELQFFCDGSQGSTCCLSRLSRTAGHCIPTGSSTLPKSSFEKKKWLKEPIFTYFTILINFTALPNFWMRKCSCLSLEHVLLFIWDINTNSRTCVLGISDVFQALAGHPSLSSTVEPMHIKTSSYRAQCIPSALMIKKYKLTALTISG